MDPSVYAARRRRVLSALGDGVLVIPAAPVALRNNDVEHDYRQDSDFHWLCGFDEPESVLVLRGGKRRRATGSPASSPASPPFTLFVRPRDKEREVWDGVRAGVKGAVSSFGADQAFPIAELGVELPRLLEGADRIFYRLGRDRAFDDRLIAALDRVRVRARLGVRCPSAIVDPATVLHELRLRKGPPEVAAMRRAAAITGEAHCLAMARARPGMYEYEIDGLIAGVFRQRGAERPAYGSIVGSGPNATVLHYRQNDRKMRGGDLLLIDAGCEYGYYASDITRTFPVSGKFTAPQRRLYQLVLDAQLASIEACRPGRTLEEIHAITVGVLARGMVRLGLIDGPPARAIKEQRYRPYYMHRTSHWLGMDVHDVGAYHADGKPRRLEPGMVITVEPGIYVAQRSAAPAEYRGIGIRIEDDILITRGAPTVLTAAVPKTVADVERACAR